MAAYARSLEQVVRDGVVIATATSEPGQDLTRPATTARGPFPAAAPAA